MRVLSSHHRSLTMLAGRPDWPPTEDCPAGRAVGPASAVISHERDHRGCLSAIFHATELRIIPRHICVPSIVPKRCTGLFYFLGSSPSTPRSAHISQGAVAKSLWLLGSAPPWTLPRPSFPIVLAPDET